MYTLPSEPRYIFTDASKRTVWLVMPAPLIAGKLKARSPINQYLAGKTVLKVGDGKCGEIVSFPVKLWYDCLLDGKSAQEREVFEIRSTYEFFQVKHSTDFVRSIEKQVIFRSRSK